MKNKIIQSTRLMVQILFFIGLVTSLIPGFMNIWPTTLIMIFFISIIAGNFYCGWLCPFGSLQEWLGKLGSLFMKKKFHMPRKAQHILQFAKYIFYGAILLNTSLGVFGSLSQTSAFNSNFYFLRITGAGSLEQLRQILSIPVIAYLTIYLVGALFFHRPFCNYFCPDGVKYGLLSFIRVFTIKRNSEKCVNCKKCSRACPMQIDVASCGNLRNANCINCMKCVSVCPIKNTLKYGPCIEKPSSVRHSIKRNLVYR